MPPSESVREMIFRILDQRKERVNDSVIKICQYPPTSDMENYSILTYGQLKRLYMDIHQFFDGYLPAQSRINVGVCVQNKMALIPILMALWKSRKACVMLSPAMDSCSWPLHSSADTSFVVSCVVTDVYAKDVFENAKCLTTFRLFSNVFHVYQMCREFPPDQFNEDNDICIGISTSGSTGQPKNVLVPWVAIFDNANDLIRLFELNTGEVIAQVSPCTFDPFFVDLFMALLNSEFSILLVNEKNYYEPGNYFSAMEKTDMTFRVETSDLPFNVEQQTLQATFLQTTPSIYKAMRRDSTYWEAIKNVKHLLLGGEVFPEDIFLHDRRPNEGCHVYDIYGVTEASCWTMITRKFAEPYRDVEVQHMFTGTIASISHDGELMIIMRDLQRLCIIQDQPPTQIIATGDMAVRCERLGNIIVKGRKDHMIKKFGIRICTASSRRFLTACCDTTDNITDFAIVFEPERQLIGWFVSFADQEEEQLAVRFLHPWSTILLQLSEKERPDLIIQVKKLPYTQNGKINVIQLRERLKILSATEVTFLGDIWNEVLNIQPMDPLRTFVDCGGTSFSAMVLINKLEMMGRTVPRTLFSRLMKGANFREFERLVNEAAVLDPREDEPQAEDADEAQGWTLNVQWMYFMHKCVDAPPQLVVIDETNYIVVGSHSSQLSMVNCADGTERWSTNLQGRIQSGVAVSADQERLFMGCLTGHINCIASSDGRALWTFTTGRDVKSTPVVSGGGKFVYCGSYDRNIYRLDQMNGQVRGSHSLPGSILATPLIFNQLVIVATLDGSCTALRLDLSAIVWAIQIESSIFSSPCRIGLNIFVANVEGRVYCIDGATGKKLRSLNTHGNIFSSLTPIPGKDAMTFGCHNKGQHIIYADGSSKSLKLEATISATADATTSAIVSATTSGSVFRISLDTWTVAHTQLPGEVFSSPKIVGDCIYVGCRDNFLYCIKMLPPPPPPPRQM